MTMKNLLTSEKYALTLAKILALTGCHYTPYFYRVEKMKVFKKLLGQQGFILSIPRVMKLLSNHQQC